MASSNLATMAIILLVLVPGYGTTHKSSKNCPDSCKLEDIVNSFERYSGSCPYKLDDCCEYKQIRLLHAEDTIRLHLSFLEKAKVDKQVNSHSYKFQPAELSCISSGFKELKDNQFYVVARVNQTDSVKITVTAKLPDDKQPQETELTTNVDHIIFGPLRLPRVLNKPEHVIQLTFNSSVASSTYNESYLLFCYPKGTDGLCQPLIEGNYVRCLCFPTKVYSVKFPPILLLILILWSIAAYYFKKANDRLSATVEPETQILLIMCNHKNFIYQYEVIFRVGCPSAQFDMHTTYIDISLMTGPKSNREVIGSPIRFATSRLPDTICGEMKCHIGKLTRLNKIDAIKVRHSGDAIDPRVQKIYMFDLTVRDLNFDEIIQEAEVNRHITQIDTTIDLHVQSSVPIQAPSQTTESSTKSHRGGPPTTLYTAKAKKSELPALPVQKLNPVESCIIFTVAVLFAGAISITHFQLPTRRLFRPLWKWTAKVLPFLWPADTFGGALCNVLWTNSFTLTFIFCTVYLYRTIVKRYYYEQKYLSSSTGSQYTLWAFAMNATMIVAIMAAVILSYFMVYQTRYFTTRQVWFWLGSYSITLAVLWCFWSIQPFLSVDFYQEPDKIE